MLYWQQNIGIFFAECLIFGDTRNSQGFEVTDIRNYSWIYFFLANAVQIVSDTEIFGS